MSKIGFHCLSVIIIFSFLFLGAVNFDEAHADLKVCNKTHSLIGIAVGHRDMQSWISEGWWNIEPNSCNTILSGDLIARYYYIYAINYERGGYWGGKAYMCTQEKEFTIRGIKDCQERGHGKSGFFEVDSGEDVDWTVNIKPQKGESK